MDIARSVCIESSSGGREFTLDSVHAAEGNIFLVKPISTDFAMNFVSLMKYMAKDEKEVTLYINSPGGEVEAGLVMYDVIQAYPYDINICCVGMAASMAAVLLAGGRKGRRFILPHSKVMIHEPLISDGFGGSATTIEKKTQRILEVKSQINGILAKHTRKTVEEIDKATAFDNVMTAEEAISFGICDKIKSVF